MPKIGADEVITRKHNRGFIQAGGARPTNTATFYGLDAQYFHIGDATKPNLGAIKPIWVHDPRIPGRFRLIGRAIDPPALASADIVMHEKHGNVPKQIGVIGCLVNVYIASGVCKDLSSLLNGWDDFITTYAGGLVENVKLGARTSFMDDVAIEDTLTVTWADIYGVGKLAFGADFATQVDRELVDVVYGSNQQCGNCGPADDGTQRIYGITKTSGAGSPGIPAELAYTVNGGVTKFSVNIAGLGASEDPISIDVAGDKLIVCSTTAIYWATLNAKTGIPGAFTKVTTGLVANKNLSDVYVLSSREIFFAALGGYIYFSSDITAGVTVLNAGNATTNDLWRISGDESDTLVATGAASTVIKSINRGGTWATTTTNPSAISADFKAVAVLDINRFWVGANILGRMYYTLDGGETWVHQGFTGAGAGSVRDIVFVNDEVGYALFDNNTPTAYLLTTFDGGKDWARNDSGSDRILSWPVFNRGNRVAYPRVSDTTAAVNNIIVAGLASDNLDGIWLQGQAARL